jgi:hypothetical protein
MKSTKTTTSALHVPIRENRKRLLAVTPEQIEWHLIAGYVFIVVMILGIIDPLRFIPPRKEDND